MTDLVQILILTALLTVCWSAPQPDPEEETDSLMDADQWVLNIPQGHEKAKRVAEEEQLNFLGEVIPNSNLFHFSVKDHSRRKRSTDDASLHKIFSSHPHISEVHPQSQKLKRDRRLPLVQLILDENLLARLLRQTPGAKDKQELCFIHTQKTSQHDSKRCVFPFGFKGKTYIDCTTDHSSNGAEWCATEVDDNGQVVAPQWGDCDRSNLKCFGETQIPTQRPEGARPPAPQLPPPGRFQIPPQFLQNQAPFSPNQGFTPGLGFPGGRNSPQGPPQGPPQGQFWNPFAAGGFPFPQISGSGGDVLNELDLMSKDFPPEKTDEKLIQIADTLKTHFNDKAWPYMWFLNRGGAVSNGLDMNVDEAWTDGYTGKGVVVTILDDGIERTHPDLEDNYDPKASTDLNGNDEDPMPRYDPLNTNKHGTRCAGTVAAVANNSFCAVGIAYNSKVGGIRILDGSIVDALEAKALSFNRDHIDIYSASWGPADNGETVDGPGPFASRALRDGVDLGRNGKGSIFVWASGNGGKYNDSCNADGYTSSIYTLSVSSVSEYGEKPWYSEACSSSLATTYSSGIKGKSRDRKVVTTDLNKKCTDQHTGTSASSPMAAGIIALGLEANPDLSWRDLQHLVVRTSRPRGNLKAKDWKTNGVGLEYSHLYGFGLMDAGKLAKVAKVWKTVPKQVNCTTELSAKEVTIKPVSSETFTIDASSCSHIKHLEHVQVHIELDSQASRGDLNAVIVSPYKTSSVLLAQRPFDKVRTGFSSFSKWPMMSVHFWGESVTSKTSDWKLTIANGGDRIATFKGWKITFFGTEEDPQPGTGVVLNVAPVVEDSETATDSEESVTENQSPALTLEEIDALRGKKIIQVPEDLVEESTTLGTQEDAQSLSVAPKVDEISDEDSQAIAAVSLLTRRHL